MVHGAPKLPLEGLAVTGRVGWKAAGLLFGRDQIKRTSAPASGPLWHATVHRTDSSSLFVVECDWYTEKQQFVLRSIDLSSLFEAVSRLCAHSVRLTRSAFLPARLEWVINGDNWTRRRNDATKIEWPQVRIFSRPDRDFNNVH